MKEESLLTSTVILTIASFITRTIGMASILFISHLLGTQGMGLYQLIISVYTVGVVFASSGISISVSKLVAEHLAQKKYDYITKIMQTAFIWTLFISSVVVATLYLLGPRLSTHIIGDIRVLKGLFFLSLSIPFMAISACFKGYFYATKHAIYPASADILEQCVKLSLIVALLTCWLPYGITYGFVGIGVGITIGEMVSCSYMSILYLRDRKRHPRTTNTPKAPRFVFFQLLSIVLPVALIAYVSSLFMSIENMLIPKGLQGYGISTETSLSIYGMVTGMIVPILFFPAAFLTAFANTLIPEIAKANILGHKKRVHYTSSRVLQFTFFLSIFITAFYFQFADAIGLVLYNTMEVGPYLRILSLLVPFMYVEVIADSILKGLGQQLSCLKYSIIDSIFRITTIYFLLPIKGITAFLTIMLVSSLLTATLTFSKLIHTTKLHIQYSNWMAKPFVCALFATQMSQLLIRYLLPQQLLKLNGLILSLVVSGLVYLALLFVLQCLTTEDISWLKKHLSFLKQPKSTLSYSRHSRKL